VRPDYVYHLAGEFGRKNGEDHYESLWRTNAIGTKNLIRLQERDRFRLIFFSSSEIYGDLNERLSEDLTSRRPLRPLNDYAISKWVNELQIMNSASVSQTETVRVRLFNTYGPGERFSPYRSVVCQFVYKALHDLPYDVFTRHTRSLTYVDDTVAALATIAEKFHTGSVYNISAATAVSMKDLSDIVLRKLGRTDQKVTYREVESQNALHKSGDNTLASRDLNFGETVTLSEGLDRTIAWQRAAYQTR